MTIVTNIMIVDAIMIGVVIAATVVIGATTLANVATGAGPSGAITIGSVSAVKANR